jgi:diadenosine tetraphosphatase ApaH/serine/threonine PP2A family protein phosphatase
MVVFVGDLVDRGPDVPGVLRLAFDMLRAGTALCVLGNHEHKLLRKLDGRDVKIAHGLQETLMQLARAPEALVDETRQVLRGLAPHLVLDEGRLVVAHAGIRPELVGRTTSAARSFALYGDTTGEVDALGLPVRRDWAAHYQGEPHVVYGHTPVETAAWVGRTIDVDTGCVFGGALSAVRWPERDVVRVPAARVYWQRHP